MLPDYVWKSSHGPNPSVTVTPVLPALHLVAGIDSHGLTLFSLFSSYPPLYFPLSLLFSPGVCCSSFLPCSLPPNPTFSSSMDLSQSSRSFLFFPDSCIFFRGISAHCPALLHRLYAKAAVILTSLPPLVLNSSVCGLASCPHFKICPVHAVLCGKSI